MNQGYLRPLIDNLLTERFAEGILGLKGNAKAIAATKIMQAELHLATMTLKPTLRFKEYRSPQCREDNERENLRQRILKDLINKCRLDNDDKIRLGKGGALPQTDIRRERRAFFITGLPASGKSWIASQIADAWGAVILDSDYAKRKFPEFTQGQYGASVLHDESTVVVFGDDQDPESLSLEGYCLREGCNVVIPKIGHDADGLRRLATYFAEHNYSVHLTLVDLDRQQATLRAYQRFVKSNRYVPLSLIFDVYSNNPALAYYQLKEQSPPIFASFGKISTDVALGESPRFIEASDGNPASLFSPTS